MTLFEGLISPFEWIVTEVRCLFNDGKKNQLRREVEDLTYALIEQRLQCKNHRLLLQNNNAEILRLRQDHKQSRDERKQLLNELHMVKKSKQATEQQLIQMNSAMIAVKTELESEKQLREFLKTEAMVNQDLQLFDKGLEDTVFHLTAELQKKQSQLQLKEYEQNKLFSAVQNLQAELDFTKNQNQVLQEQVQKQVQLQPDPTETNVEDSSEANKCQVPLNQENNDCDSLRNYIAYLTDKLHQERSRVEDLRKENQNIREAVKFETAHTIRKLRQNWFSECQANGELKNKVEELQSEIQTLKQVCLEQEKVLEELKERCNNN